MYRWYNIRSGEIVKNFPQMIKTEIRDLIYYHFIGVWIYSRKGF